MTAAHDVPRRPRIVITVGVPARQPDPALAVRKNELYAAAIARHGGDPVLVDASAPASVTREAIASMDGLVLSGGADIHPRRYGEAVAGTHAPEQDRDDLEADAWNAAAASVPVLGICRGLQAINVFLGGRLVQHLDGHAGPAYGQGAALQHQLSVVPGTNLARILGVETGDTPLYVNSYHHQGVDQAALAAALVPSAWASSEGGDLVEGIELPGDRFVVGVQCHPERTESTPPAFERLWAAFVQACARAVPGEAPVKAVRTIRVR